MKPVHPFLVFLLFTRVTAAAQHGGSIRAVLADSITREPISDATISILDTADASLLAFGRRQTRCF